VDLNTVERRLEELRREFAVGQRGLDELAARRDELTVAMLRVSGAIQVLEELRTASGEEPDRAGVEVPEGPWMTTR
jgi:hypothetical protein